MTNYQQYLSWLQDHNETRDRVPFKDWLSATYPNQDSDNNALVVGEVVGGNLPKSQATSLLEQVGANADLDLRLGLTALARSRMSRIANIMNFVDRVEDQLVTRVQVEAASIDQLLGVGRLLRNSLKDDLNLVGEVVNIQRGRGEPTKNFNLSVTEQIVNVGDSARKTLESRDSRDRSRTVLEGMLKVIQKHESEPSEPAA